MLKLLELLSLRAIKIRTTRILLTALGIAAGVALFVSIRLMTVSISNHFHESAKAMAGEADLTITGLSTGFSEKYLEQIESTTGVKFAIPVVETQAYYVESPQKQKSIMVLGLDLLKEGSVRAYQTTSGEDVLSDPLVFLNQPDSIIVTDTFANENGFKLKDSFQLRTANGTKKFVIRGILKPEGVAKAFGGSLAIMDIDGARYTFGKEEKFDRIDIVVDDDSKIPSIQEDLQNKLGETFNVRLPEGQAAALIQMTKAFTGLLSFLGMMSLIVALFLVYNTMSITIAERETEIATLRTLGMTKRKVRFFFISEAFIFGTISSFIGVILGAVLAQKMMSWVVVSMEAQLLTPMPISKVSLDSVSLIVSLLVGIFVTVLAVWIPAKRASEIQPITVLKKTANLEADTTGWFVRSLKFGPVFLAILIASAVFNIGDNRPAIRALETLCYIVGVLLTTPLLVSYILKGLRRIAVKTPRIGTLFTLSIDGLLRSPQTTWLNVMSLSISFLLVGNTLILNASFKESLVGWFEKAFSADLSLAQGNNIIGVQFQPMREDLRQGIQKISGIRKDDGNGVYGLRIVDFQYDKKIVKIKAFDQPPLHTNYSLFDVQTGEARIEGAKLFQGNTTFISDNFAKHFNVKVGDKITYNTPSGPLEVTVLGFVTDFISPEGTIYLSRDLYKKYWKDTLVSVFYIYKDQTNTVEQLKEKVESQLGDQGIVATTNKTLLDQAIKSIEDGLAPTRAIEFVALAVALLGLINTLFIRALQRFREFGVLRSTGLSKKQLNFLIITEACLTSGLAATITLILNAFLAYLWQIESLSELLGWFIRPKIPVATLVGVCGLALIMGALAAILPSRKVQSLTIKEAIHYD